jgi:hypothetical protein
VHSQSSLARRAQKEQLLPRLCYKNEHAAIARKAQALQEMIMKYDKAAY